MDPSALITLITVLGSFSAAQIGAIAFLARALGKVRSQVTPNGGNTNSLGDRIARIEATTDQLSREQGRMWNVINRTLWKGRSS